MLVALALAVTTWSAGFDVLYALQDVAFDRSQRLYSLPGRSASGAPSTSRAGLHVERCSS
jgi:4-hydroxybenzoate polyprenyltransferase